MSNFVTKTASLASHFFLRKSHWRGMQLPLEDKKEGEQEGGKEGRTEGWMEGCREERKG